MHRDEVYNTLANNSIMHGNNCAFELEIYGDVQTAIGKYFFDRGQYEQARHLFQSTLTIYERVCPDNIAKRAEALTDLGRSLSQLGKHHHAIHQYEVALKLNEACCKNPLDSAAVISDIGKSLYGLGKYDEAIESFEKALVANENKVTADPLLGASIIAAIGAVLLSKNRCKKALCKSERALEIQEGILGRDQIESASLICLIGVIFQRKGRYRKALRQFQRALTIYGKTFGEGHIKLADTINSIGLSYLHLGRCHQALELFQQVLGITERTFGKDHIKTESAIFNMGASYLFLGRCSEALEQYERSMKIYGAKLCEIHQTDGGPCLTKADFIQRHAAERDGKINPLVKNHLISFNLVEKLRLACIGKGVKGKGYRLVVQLLPLGMKLYGKYNELEIIPIPGLFEFVEPSLYGL